jgi:hypothetical protein
MADIGLRPLPPYNKFRTRRRAEERSDIRRAKSEERNHIRQKETVIPV